MARRVTLFVVCSWLLLCAWACGRSDPAPARKRPRHRRTNFPLKPAEKQAVLQRRRELYRDRVSEANQKRIDAFAKSLAGAARKCLDEHVGHLQLDQVRKGTLDRFNFVRADTGPCGQLANMVKSGMQPMVGQSLRVDRLLLTAAEYVDWYLILKRFVPALKVRIHRDHVVRAVGRLQRLTQTLETIAETIHKTGKYLKKKEIYQPPAHSVTAVRQHLATLSQRFAVQLPPLLEAYRRELAAGVQKKPFRINLLRAKRAILEREHVFISAEIQRVRSDRDAYDKRTQETMKSYFAALATVTSEFKKIETFLEAEPGWKKTRAKHAFGELVDVYNRWIALSNGLDTALRPQ